MICNICGEDITNSKSIKLFEQDVCTLCIYSVSEIPINHILYDFYKEKIKALQKMKLKEIL